MDPLSVGPVCKGAAGLPRGAGGIVRITSGVIHWAGAASSPPPLLPSSPPPLLPSSPPFAISSHCTCCNHHQSYHAGCPTALPHHPSWVVPSSTATCMAPKDPVRVPERGTAAAAIPLPPSSSPSSYPFPTLSNPFTAALPRHPAATPSPHHTCPPSSSSPLPLPLSPLPPLAPLAPLPPLRANDSPATQP